MSYQAIYRKWRPLTFQDVVGQSHITDTLKTELRSGRTAHAYLLCGTRGTGKTTTAKIFSRAINCENPLPTGDPCNECAACTSILNGSAMDVVEIDAASNNGVDNIRELREDVIYTPSELKYKVYIIDEVHMLSTGAFNALLKTLEEPPAHVVFILATTEPHKIPATIQSRCQRFDFCRITTGEIAARITKIVREDGISIDDSAIRLIAKLGDGSMRDALSVLDLCGGIEGEITREVIERVTGAVSQDALYQIAEAVAAEDTSSALTLLDRLIRSGGDIPRLAEELLGVYRNIIMEKTVENAADLLELSAEDQKRIADLAAASSKELLLYAIGVLADTVAVCKWSTAPRIMLECALIKICCPRLDSSSDAFAARLQKLESRASAPATVTAVKEPAPVIPVIPPIIEEEKPPFAMPTDEEPPFAMEEPPVIDEEPPFAMEEPPVVDEQPPFATEEPVTPASVRPDAAFLADLLTELPGEPEGEPEPFFMSDAFAETPKKPEPETEIEAADLSAGFDWKTIQKGIKAINPALHSYLLDAEGKAEGDNIIIIFENPLFLENIRQNEEFSKTLKHYFGGRSVIYRLAEEEVEAAPEEDPIDQLIRDGEGLGEQMTLF